MSLTKAELKDIQTLHTKKGRKQQKKFLAEGARVLEEALRFSFRPSVVFVNESLLSERARALMPRLETARVQIIEIPARQLESIAETESPQGLVAIFNAPTFPDRELFAHSRRKFLVCDQITDPGNLGTLARSALAFEFNAIITLGASAELYAPKVVRSSAGALFGLPAKHMDYADFLDAVNHQQLTLITADIAGRADLKELAKRKDGRLALVVGAEAEGISPQILERADVRIRIPHADTVDSLNAAVAGSILMKELYP